MISSGTKWWMASSGLHMSYLGFKGEGLTEYEGSRRVCWQMATVGVYFLCLFEDIRISDSFSIITFLQSFGVDGLPVGFIPAQRHPVEMLDGGCRERGVCSSHPPTRAKRKGIAVRTTASPDDRPGRPPSAAVQFGGKSQRIV